MADVARLVCSLTIPGDPARWERQRVTVKSGRALHFTSREQRAAQNALRTLLKVACRQPERHFPLAVRLDFYRATQQRIDIDNLVKHVLDCANKVIWHDDSQVVTLVATKHVGVRGEARTELLVERVLPHETARHADDEWKRVAL